MWERNGLSLFSLMQALLLATSIHRSIVSASSSCSNSFRFDQLCPDPRFGSRDPSVTTNFSPDTNIQLNSNANNRRTLNGYGARPSTGGSAYSSSMLIKDSSTPSCDFHLNGIETAVVAGINVMHSPWDFRHANTCNHIVKISYDLFDATQLAGGISTNSYSKSTKNQSKNDRVCENEIGIRRHANNNAHHYDSDFVQNDETKRSVYFWHNFTLYSHSAEFTDTLTNYHLSLDDVSCKADKKNGQYVQIAVVISKSGRCEIILQQYKIEENRSPWGCTLAGYPIPYPIQFCGSYECTQSNSILTGLKLLSRRIIHDDDNVDDRDSRSIQTRTDDVHIKKKKGPSLAESEQQYDYSEENHSKSEDHYGSGDLEVSLDPCSTSTTPSSEDLGEEEEPMKPTDWNEAAFKYGFAGFGFFFILFILCILRTRTARELCSGYPYEGPPRPSVAYHASSNTVAKNAVPPQPQVTG